MTGRSPSRAEAERQDKQARVDALSISQSPAPADVAERLHFEPGDLVVERVNYYFTDDEPVQTRITHIPARADRNAGRRGPWLRTLDRLGMGFDS